MVRIGLATAIRMHFPVPTEQLLSSGYAAVQTMSVALITLVWDLLKHLYIGRPSEWLYISIYYQKEAIDSLQHPTVYIALIPFINIHI